MAAPDYDQSMHAAKGQQLTEQQQLTAHFPAAWVSRYRNVKPSWILLQQLEMIHGSDGDEIWNASE